MRPEQNAKVIRILVRLVCSALYVSLSAAVIASACEANPFHPFCHLAGPHFL